MAIKIDTHKVINVANNIDQKNNCIREDFKSADMAMRFLEQNWSSTSSEKVLQRYYDLKEKYSEPRFVVMNGYSRFLRECVGEKYDVTETTISLVASLFK